MAASVESQHQRAYIAWARQHPLARLAFAIPNGGKRDRVTAAIMKAEGVLAGVCDIFVPIPRGAAHGLYIEFKAGRNKPTPAQAEFMDAMRLLDYRCAVAYDWALAAEHTRQYLAGNIATREVAVLVKG